MHIGLTLKKSENINASEIPNKSGNYDYNWNWSRVCLTVENFKTLITSKMIKRIKSSGTTWKLYTDESYIKNQDKAGAGEYLALRTD
ncbi:hypothetical protein H5410_040501 [Solanum commersonii]|uniref:Uncharacterized protein n=1 Tax=Solanum commersonii TaxID=4109 RepID=A0A9J5XP14_SOLCO|nr:hypothetical protein H5410_040501 [Solanum commersonii]